jgi:predicted DNA-binding protein YlxM (UPF0122 family)
MIKHGRNRGGRGKLKEKDIVEIKKMLSLNIYSEAEIAKEFNVTQTTIHRIKTSKRWKNVKIYDTPYSIYEKYHPWLQHFLSISHMDIVWKEIRKEYVHHDILMCKFMDRHIKCLRGTFNNLQKKVLKTNE